MALKWNNPRQLDRDFASLQAEYDRASILFLAKIGEEMARYARETGSYEDRSGNLRNSIGYIVIQNGTAVVDSFEGNIPSREGYAGDANLAHKKGLEYAMQVGHTLGGYKTYLVMVAGMEYAVFVQSKGRVVLQATENHLEANVPSYKDEFRRYLKSRGL